MGKFYFFISLGFISCNSILVDRSKMDAIPFLEGTKSIFIDSLTSHYNYSMELSYHDYRAFFCFINAKEFVIYVNDWTTGEIIKKIPLSKDGPNAIHYSGLEGVCMEGLDRFLIYSEDVYTFYRINDRGEILAKYDLGLYGEWGNESRGWPQVFSANPLLRLDSSTFILQCAGPIPKVKDYTSVYFSHQLTFHENLGVKPLLRYSPIYNKGNWGNYLPFCTYSTINYKENLLYASFSRDDSILVLSLLNGNFTTRYAGSYFFSNSSIEPLTEYPNKEFPDRSREKLQDFITPMYFAMLHDSVNNYIYRIVRNEPPSKELVSKNGGNFRLDQGYAIIVMDEEFNKLGEFNVPKNRYSGEAIFVESGKIYWLLNASSQQDESALTFDIYDFSSLRSQ